MRRFHFRLERVLAEKRRVERQRQHELALLVDTLAQRRRRGAQLHNRTAALGRCLGGWLEAPSSPVKELVLVQREIAAGRQQLCRLEREIGWLEQAVQVARRRLADCARERLLLERLRERALADFLLRLRRTEAQVLDDIRRPGLAAVWGS